MVMDKPDGLTELDRSIIGGAKRITIPMHNKVLLREVADALRGLAQVMDIQSRLSETGERDALLRVSHEINHTNRLIKQACRVHDVELRDGRPPDSKRLGLNVNTNGTGETVPAAQPLYLYKKGGS